MKIVTASAIGIVSQTPDMPMIFGRIRINTATRIRDRREEMRAEIKPLPKAVKYPERKTLNPMKMKTGLNSFNPSHVRLKTFPSATNKWMICCPPSSETAMISTEVIIIVIKL